ncbi:HAD family phosphatase [Rhodococcus aerolatus]
MHPTSPAAGPRAVLWDMDGTLLDSERLWDVSLAELAVHLGGEMTTELRHSLVGGSLRNAVTALLTHLDLPVTGAALDEAATVLDARTAELFAAGIPWRPGAQDALTLAPGAGWAQALVTNTGRGLTEDALGTLGREHFTATVCGDEVAHGKPAPDPYLRAAELLGLDPADCLAVEDSPTGAAAAEAAGCAVLVVPLEVEVPTSPRRTHRPSLLGLTPADLTAAWRAAGTRDDGEAAAAWEDRRP